jgi:hypothetical protein
MGSSIWDMLGALVVALTIPAMMVIGLLANAIFHLV